MFGKRLVRARQAAGLSMRELAKQIGVSANSIKKYEHGHAMPDSTKIIKLARSLNVRSEYFFRPIKINLAGIEYRKRASAPKKLLNQIHGDVMDQVERWGELLDLYPDSIQPVPKFSLPNNLPSKVDSAAQIEMIADLVRCEWDLGFNPIPDMIDTLESKGVMIIVTSVESNNKFDGLAGNIEETPLIVISAHQSGDRQRFTLAHELGHLVLRGRLDENMNEEKACNHFAGAILFPQKSVMQHLGQNRRALEAQELYMLKHEFGISMMAVLMRAGQCNVIGSSLQKQYFMTFNKLHWRTEEPGKAYPNEETYLFKQLLYRALGEGYIGESKAAELMKMSLSSFHKERKLGVSSAAIN